MPPSDERIKAIAQDYRDMQPLFFNEPPDCLILMQEMTQLEQALNDFQV